MKLGILGCGYIGRKRAMSATGHSIVAAYDTDRKKAEAFCGDFGCRACATAEELVQSGIDIAVVATTHDQLAGLALLALQADCHVLLEKPCARNASELEPVAAEARRRHKKVKAGYNHRFHPSLIRAKRLAEEGAVGDLMFIRGRYGHGGRLGYQEEWRFNPHSSGGGELLDQGSHLIDLSQWFLGKFTGVQGLLSQFFWKGRVEDNCFMTLATSNGSVAQLQASWTEWKNLFSFEIYGQTGKLQIDGIGGTYGLEQLALYAMLPQMGPPETTIWQYPFPDNSWRLELEELILAIEEDRRPLGDVDEAMATLQVIDSLYASNKGVS